MIYGREVYNINQKTLTPVEQQMVDTFKEVREYKKSCEANIVSIFWKNPELLYQYENLNLNDFTDNCWRVYFVIAYEIIVKESKKSLDDITVGLYLKEHPKLSSKYKEYGGYNTIDTAKEYVKEENLDGYIKQLNKWKVVINLLKNKFPVHDRIKDFIDMDLNQIYEEYEAILEHVFINAESELKVYNIADGIDELIERLDEGCAVGLPYYNLPMITDSTGGLLEGNISIIAALSNVGKTTFALNSILPSILENNERIIIMLNEGGIDKWQREFIAWVSNNILGKDLQKYIIRNGKYSKEVKDLIKECAEWIKKQKDNKSITIIPLPQWTTQLAIKIMRKFSALGVRHYLIDTYKSDAGSRKDPWLDMMQNMVDLYDVVKPEAKNLQLTLTAQLEKGKTSIQRFYGQNNMGVAKNIIDCASTVIMLRNFFNDELEGEKRELKVCERLKGTKTIMPVKLDKNKNYQIAFVVKTREGEANKFQVVLEHDLSRNTLKEIGYTVVPVDF